MLPSPSACPRKKILAPAPLPYLDYSCCCDINYRSLPFTTVTVQVANDFIYVIYYGVAHSLSHCLEQMTFY